MPFGISHSQPDCSGWATVKQEADGSFTTIGCHPSKQDAIDQMVVVSLSEDIEPLGQIDDMTGDPRCDLSPLRFGERFAVSHSSCVGNGRWYESVT